MKNILLGFIILSAFCISCSKDEPVCNYTDSTVTASAGETANVQSYLSTNNITGTTLHPTGFYYKINQTGTGQAIVNLCSNVTVKYTGRLTNGTIFDQTTAGATATFRLGDLIAGWQKGLPLISSGGKITLYIPPSLGYGSDPVRDRNGVIVIPANSILIFDMELVRIS